MKKIFKRIMLVVAALLLCGVAKAQDAAPALVVQLKTGDKLCYELSKRPVLTFGEHWMRVTADGTEISLIFADIANYHFEDIIETGIHAVEADFNFRISAQNVYHITGCKGATVHNASGQLVNTYPVSDEIAIDLNDLPAGIYIINAKVGASSQSIKILKK